MFKSLGKLMGGGKKEPAAQPFEVPPPNPENPPLVPCLAPFPFTGEKKVYNGYTYTAPGDADFLSFRQLVDDTNGWTLRCERDGNMYAWDRPLPGEQMRLIKAFGIFEGVPPERLYDLLQDPEYRIEWDQNRLDGFCFTHLTDRCDIGYYAAKVTKPVANRDFVNMRSWRQLGAGEYIIMSTSVPVAECPPKQGLVRAVVRVSGYLVRPYGDGGCSVTYVSHSEPKGWLPSYFINQLTSKIAPNVIGSMRSAVAKYPDWIAAQGDKYKRVRDVSETPWPAPQPNLTYQWVEERKASGAAASPPVAAVDDADENEQPPEGEATQ
uniref:START domain-containing protein n=1 Tax=Neobodo designis TaxID=312471 RepID=A0A7S1Q4T1_NEODS|mmetsp:Transcript_30143/g.93013  ORF Transcript_30143/g.93013 Transcript_30143/m.93013 type:complete len:323 (+) Transcript_30143:59-1027(+)|eukprot:CAMPEP_0174853416 /NCGR_PEP_ID=MMETSP1114-20130205/28371_1 /TAXON_ID=312471 /ORGANISM="Neobodo designis, Strain CCAP 1951/1" /LENGTH=322 /DNA_ID=CAMNT_0016088061 /DNA_START=58 /DNA_END=1026 /DNA_ORIENTATION=-